MGQDILTKEQEDEILRLFIQQTEERKTLSSLEALLTSPDGFDLTTATPLQRAICRVADGVPLGGLASDPTVRRAFVRPDDIKPGRRPFELVIISAIRTAKSMLAAALAVRASQTCDLSRLSSGEVPRVSIVSLTKDLAAVTLRHLVGTIHAKPALRRLLAKEPTADTVVLHHPEGREIEIKVVAGARAGASLVARWSAGCIFDEAPRMSGNEDYVVNYDDARTAVIGRLLPGAQVVSIGSPWAPSGPIYETVVQNWGKPTAEMVVVKAPGPDMNPHWWTPERCEEVKSMDPVAYQTDVMAEFADHEEVLFPSTLLRSSTRDGPEVLPWNPRGDYVAAMDPATRGNAWTLVICTRHGNKKSVALARQWVGSKIEPLVPGQVLSEVAECCRAYNLDWAYTDQWAADSLRETAMDYGLALTIEDWTAKAKTQLFMSLASQLADGKLELPPDPYVEKDLKAVRKRATQNSISIVLPKTPDGRHCDYAPSIARAIARWIDEDELEKPAPGTVEHSEWLERELEKEEEALWREEKGKPWWDK